MTLSVEDPRRIHQTVMLPWGWHLGPQEEGLHCFLIQPLYILRTYYLFKRVFKK